MYKNNEARFGCDSKNQSESVAFFVMCVILTSEVNTTCHKIIQR